MIDMAQEVEGLSERQIAKKLEISRNTDSKFLKEGAKPPTTIQRQKVHGKKEYSDETKRILPNIDN